MKKGHHGMNLHVSHTVCRWTVICFLMTFLSLQQQISAQTRIPREVHLGIIGGANLSQYSFLPSISQKMSQGFTGGVAVRYIEETFFGLQAEFLLTQRGFKDYYEQYRDLQFSRTLTYIEVPVMAHVYFKMGKHNEIALDAGPKIGWYLTDTSSSNLPSDFGEEGSEYYVSVTAHHTLPVSKKFDYGIQAGLGYEFKFGPKVSLQLQGRYYYGLANLWPDSKADDFEQSSNQSIQIVASLWWHHIIRGKKVKRNIDN